MRRTQFRIRSGANTACIVVVLKTPLPLCDFVNTDCYRQGRCNVIGLTTGFALSWVLIDLVSFEVGARLYRPPAPVAYICVEDGVRFFTTDEFAALRTNGAIIEREPGVFVFHGDFNWSGGEYVVEPFEQFLRRITTADIVALRHRYRRATRDVHIRIAYIVRRRVMS